MPAERARGSGTHRIGFDWREVEIAKLLSLLARRRLPTDDLGRLAVAVEEIALRENGFLADNPDLRAFAEDQIERGGPYFGPTGPAPGCAARLRKNAQSARPIQRTTMTEEQAAKFWCFVAYGTAVRKGTPAAWEIWWDEDDNMSMHARFDADARGSQGYVLDNKPQPHGTWMGTMIGGAHHRRGIGILLDLLMLWRS